MKDFILDMNPTREQIPLKINLTGLTGSGKTYTALLLAAHIGTKVGVIDTEGGKCRLYLKKFEEWREGSGKNPKFSILDLTPPFSVDKLSGAIDCMMENDQDFVIIDSLSHFWSKEGGILDEVAEENSKQQQAWKRGIKSWETKGNPLYNQLTNKVFYSKLDIICTTRQKGDYVFGVSESNERKKTSITKVGTKSDQREDSEFEYDIVFIMDKQQTALVDKSRYDSIKVNDQFKKPGRELALLIENEKKDGTKIPSATAVQITEFNGLRSAGIINEDTISRWLKNDNVRDFSELCPIRAQQWIEYFKIKKVA